MTAQPDLVGGQPRTSPDVWYARSPAEVVTALGVDPAVGLSATRAARLRAAHGPNVLPEEGRVPAWRRFLAQYRSYMQIVLVVAAAVSRRRPRRGVRTGSAISGCTGNAGPGRAAPRRVGRGGVGRAPDG